MNTMDVSMRLGDAIDPCHLATDLKPLSVTDAKNGAIPLSLTSTIQTIHAGCDKASEWLGGSLQCRPVGGGWGGILRDVPEYECLYSRPSQAMYYKSLKMIMGVIFVVQVSVFGGSDRRIL